MKDITIIALGETNDKADVTALFYIHNTQGLDTFDNSKTNTTLENVTVIGIEEMVMYGNELFVTAENLDDCVTIVNDSFAWYASVVDMYAESATDLGNVDAGVNYGGIDFASMVGEKTIAKVLDKDGNEVTLAEGVLQYAKENASATAERYIIVCDDDSMFKVNVTKWSAIIKNATDLKTAKDYTIVKDNWYHVGYFKLMDDIDMSGETWEGSNKIANIGGGFVGLFEGNGKTISNLTMNEQDSGLFHSIDKNATICNLTFANVTLGHNTSGVLARKFYGGTFENISISFTANALSLIHI